MINEGLAFVLGFMSCVLFFVALYYGFKINKTYSTRDYLVDNNLIQDYEEESRKKELKMKETRRKLK
jgi:hypothetical protein